MTLLALVVAVTAGAQEISVDYPYNPDYENDGNVGVEDLMQLLSSFGTEFDIEEIMVENMSLTSWAENVSSVLAYHQFLLDSLAQAQPTIPGEIYNIISNATPSCSAYGAGQEGCTLGPTPCYADLLEMHPNGSFPISQTCLDYPSHPCALPQWRTMKLSGINLTVDKIWMQKGNTVSELSFETMADSSIEFTVGTYLPESGGTNLLIFDDWGNGFYEFIFKVGDTILKSPLSISF